MRRLAVLLIVPVFFAACGETKLRDIRQPGPGPDEFLVNPNNSLQEPPSYSDLPTPTPGQANRTDRSARDEGIRAFGGRPEAIAGGIPAADAALVNHTSRRGVDGNIRTDLAEADAKFRKRKALFTNIRIAPVDRYAQVYRNQTLNPSREAARWRRAGARTPSAPPVE